LLSQRQDKLNHCQTKIKKMKSFIDDIKHMQCIKALEIDLHSSITKHDKHIIDNAFDKAHLKLEQLHPSMRNITHNDIELLKFDNI